MNTLEASELIGCGERHVRYLIATDQLKAKVESRRGKQCWKINKSSVKDYLKRKNQKGETRGRKNGYQVRKKGPN